MPSSTPMKSIAQPSRSSLSTFLRAPWNHYSSTDLLHYFSSPRSIQYFPVIDPIETDRRKIDLILENVFDLNGETWELPSPISWMDNPSTDREWMILLHKFYYAVGLGTAYSDTQHERYLHAWVRLTASWIEQVPLDFLPSDVAGRRIQNWIFAHYYFISPESLPAIDPGFYATFLASLAKQVNYLCDHLTPSRNHRTLELCAIFLASVVFPEFQDAERWQQFSTHELIANIQRDFLPDGVHCELSTDYHHLVLKNFLWIRKLALLNQIIFPAIVDDIIKRALDFSLYAHKPDGFIPAFSDGDSRCFLDLLDQGHQLYGQPEFQYGALQGQGGSPPQVRSKIFPHSGYVMLRSGWGNHQHSYRDEHYLMFDCGPLGEGNHGHLDLLSFEMAAFGHSLIVDPGRYSYDESGETNWRVKFRETAAHNTIVIDGMNQTRYVFHKTRHKIRGPSPHHLIKTFISEPHGDFIHGIAESHEYPVVHERKILFPGLDYWLVVDRLTAQESHQYDLNFHLGSQAQNAVFPSRTSTTLTYTAPHILLAQPLAASIQGAVLQGHISRTYGQMHPAPIIRFRQHHGDACFHTVLFPFKDNQPDLTIESIPVFSGIRKCSEHEAVCLKIRTTINQQEIEDLVFLCHLDNTEPYQFDQYSFKGQVCHLRKKADDSLISQFHVEHS